MEVRQRGHSTPSSSDSQPQPSISFWICYEKNKNRIESHSKTSSCLQILEEYKIFPQVISKLASGDNDLHLMNESSGAVVAIHRSIDSQISDGDVITICSSFELERLLEKFSQYNPKATIQKSPPSIGTLAISKLKRIKHTNSTLKALQKSFENHFTQEDPKTLQTYSEVGPIFESNEIEQEDPLLKGDASQSEKHFVSTKTCDVCDVSWPDAPGHYMYRFRANNILTHHGCAQFAADIQKKYTETAVSRNNFISMTQPSQVNKPGTFFITVERAVDLPGLQILGSLAPYTKLSLLPWKEPQQTKPTELGGKNPIWKKMHENKMQLTHIYNSSITPIPLLEVEIWNYNYIADDLMACALLDMSPLLCYPNVEIRRWFMLSSRGAAAALTRSFRSNSPRIFLSIRFSPEENALSPSKKHKFRVHQLRSIGIVIPVCTLCDRVIVNVLKGAWGYRCENCHADVHKGCLVKAAAKLPCRGPSAGSNEQEPMEKDESSWNLSERFCWRNGLKFRILNDHEVPPSESQASSHNSCVGHLYVNLYSLHVCTKQCQPDVDFHIKNIYEGDTYCRLNFEDTMHETTPVLKTADPVFQERVCWKVRHRDAVLHIQAIDFNTDASFGEMSIDLFKLLQRKADKLMYRDFNAAVSKILSRRKSSDQKSDDTNASNSVSLRSYKSTGDDLERFDLRISSKALSTTPSSRKRIAGFLMAKFEYVESTRDLFRFRLPEETQLLEREEKECNVESLKATFDRFGRILRIFKWLDVEYARVISWKDKLRSSLWFGLFVILCIKVDLEYFGAYVFYGLIILLLYQLRFRLSHAYLDRWIGHLEYENDQINNLKMHRPLAALYLAVHGAQLTQRTEKAITEALYALSKDASTAKRRLYVRMKYLPNDRAPYTGTVFIPSEFEEALIGWTHAVEMSTSPIWRTKFIPPHLTASTNTFASAFGSKTRNESPFRNLNVSWRHDPQECNCPRCRTYLEYKRKHSEDLVDETPPTCGVDSHAFFFPVPQCRKKDSTGHANLVPWKSSPGLIQFELCMNTNGEIKETPEFIVAIGSIPLSYIATTSDRMHERTIPLNLLQQFEDKSTQSESETAPSLSTLQIRVRLCELEAHPTHTFASKYPNDRRNSVSLDTPSETSPISYEDSSPLDINSSEKNTMTIHTRAKRAYSDYVCSALAQKDKFSHAVLGGQLVDTFYKMMDTMKTVQNQVGRACGTVACVENVFNWTHPWKTAVVCVIFLAAALIFSVIPGRWIVLLFGCSEFGAALLKDHPPSNRFRNMLWNFLSSIPTDKDLIKVYSNQREAYDQSREKEKQVEEMELMRMRHHALWIGYVHSKSDHERHYKRFFLVYRSFRLLFWKSEEDATNDVAAFLQFLIHCEAPNNFKEIKHEKMIGFSVSGTTHQEASEKRSVVSNSAEMNKLLEIIKQDCAFI